MARPPRIRRPPTPPPQGGVLIPPPQGGFLTPLAVAGTLLMLLSAMALQLAVLQGRQLQGLERQRQQVEDRLSSAAHQLAAALQGPYRCLQPHPSSSWEQVARQQPCPTGLDLRPLQRLELWGEQVELLQWQPSGDGGLLELQQLGTAQRQRFQLRLGGPNVPSGPSAVQEVNG